MTTIAYRDGVIACEGRVTVGNAILCEAYGKIVVTDKYLAGVSGDAGYAQIFLKWVKDGCDKEQIPYDANKTTGQIDAFLVDKHGIITLFESPMIPYKIGKKDFYAVGSGANFAMGAMEMGATAVEAVKIAKKYDCYSGGRVITRCFK